MTETSDISDRVPMLQLLDVTGCSVMSLRPGANDVSRLPPGVYLMRRASDMKRDASRVKKVVIAE